mgnify:CR=1 FL=1
MYVRENRQQFLAACGATLTMGISGCLGDGGDGSSPTSEPTPTRTPTTTEAPETSGSHGVEMQRQVSHSRCVSSYLDVRHWHVIHHTSVGGLR